MIHLADPIIAYIIVVYVDDLLITYTNDKLITEIIHYTAGPDISKLLKQIFYNQSIPYT